MFFMRTFFCLFLIMSFVATPFAYADEVDVDAREAQLRKELAETEKEIAQWQATLSQKKGESASIQRDAEILNAKVKEAQAKIKAKNLEIERLGKDITVKNQTITSLDAKMDRSKESLSEIIRKTNEIDSFSVAEMILSNENLSDFFVDVDEYSSVKRSLKELFDEIRGTKSNIETEKANLDKKRTEEIDLKAVVEDQKKVVEKNEAEKRNLLAISKSQEKTYEQILSERQKKAAQIRTALFALRDTAAIPFGTALTYANEVSKATGVRPAFLLAILTQETNLGANIGTCNRPGDPVSKQWQAIMPGATDIAAGLSKRNDEAAYLRITSALGLDPASMPLSCPWGSGWGGAMGPSQFIPTTWESYQARIASALKIKTPNPWEPEHAFMASGIYLSELGAGAKTFTAERTAALKYYAGGNWAKPANAFYGDQVMAKAQNIQLNMIDPLENL